MNLKLLEYTTITCLHCNEQQKFCITGMPLSGLCTLCRKKQWRLDNPELKKPDCFCINCNIKVGKNNKTLLCRTCYVSSRNEVIKEYNNNYDKQRSKKDPLFKLAKSLRSRLSHAIRDLSLEKNNISAISDLGCSITKLKIHLQLGFHRNSRDKHEYMTWDNYGKWHIDHIIPLVSAKTEQDLRTLMKYTNLQPLWAKDNLRKSGSSKLTADMSYNDPIELRRAKLCQKQ